MFVNIVFVALAINACWAAATTAPKGDIVRPCHLSNLRCIGENLSANSRCNPYVRGYLPNKYALSKVRHFAPFFNETYVDDPLIVRNHNNCKVSEFFFNVKKDTAVLSLDCPNLDFESNRTLIHHYSKREDVEYKYKMRAVYPLIRLTVNLRHADKLDICNAFVFGDVTALSTYTLVPLDKPTDKFLSRDLSFLKIYDREITAERAPWLFKYYVNAYICNFFC